MNKTNDNIEALVQANPGIKMLAQLRDGGVVTELTDKFGQAIAAVKRTGAKGRLTLELAILPDDKGEVRTVDITAEVKVKLPERKKRATTFFVVGEQSLSRTGVVDDQPEFDFETRIALPAPVAKLPAAAKPGTN